MTSNDTPSYSLPPEKYGKGINSDYASTQKRAGFVFIELLVVMLIFLAGLAILANFFSSCRDSASTPQEFSYDKYIQENPDAEDQLKRMEKEYEEMEKQTKQTNQELADVRKENEKLNKKAEGAEKEVNTWFTLTIGAFFGALVTWLFGIIMGLQTKKESDNTSKQNKTQPDKIPEG